LAKRFSVILVPEGDGMVKRLHLRSGYLRFAICSCCVVLSFLAFFAHSYYTERIDRKELQRLRIVTSEQRQTLRQLANLDPVTEDIPVAIGGLAEFESTAVVDDIQRQINQLQVEIELRRQSQEVVRNLLNDQVSLSRATPKGWPTKGWLTSYFGMRKSPFTGRRVMHEGLDIAANVGTPVVATADGVVARVKYSPGYGKMIIIDHGYGYRTVFGHNSKILVKAGQRIKRGDIVAKVGNTGQSTGPHLHYELRLNGVPIDPRKTL